VLVVCALLIVQRVIESHPIVIQMTASFPNAKYYLYTEITPAMDFASNRG
jgi:hypothetical protein